MADPPAARPGWYPDPDRPDQFRYFDGADWTDRTAADARGLQTEPESRRRRGYAAWAAGAVAVGLALIVVWNVSSRPPRPEEAPRQQPDSSVGPSFDSTGPLFTGNGRPCPVGEPARQPEASSADRVRSGNLSFPRQSDFSQPIYDRRLTFATEVRAQGKLVHANARFETPAWPVELAVGRVPTSDGFDTTSRLAAAKILDCLSRSTVYRSLSPVIRILRSGGWGLGDEEPGREGHLLSVQVLVNRPAGGFPGDQVTIAVRPDDQGWSFFLSITPIGAAELAEQARETLEGLRSA